MKNTNGKGSISYENERKTYRAAIVDPNGKRIRKRFTTKQEAEEWLTITRASFFTKTYIPDSNMTLGEWMIEYLQTYAKPHVKQSTYLNYKKSAGRLEPLESIKLEELSPVVLQKFFNNEFIGKEASGKASYIFLNIILEKAVKLEIIRKNPLINVLPPVVTKKEIQIFTKEEIHQIITTAQTSGYRKYVTLIKLATATGARMGELFSLKHSNIYPTHISIESTVYVIDGHTIENSPKSDASKRNVSISKAMYDELRSLDHNCEYVFHSCHNTPLKQTNFAIAWGKLLKKAGVPHRTFHALRHTHATLLLANGIPLLEVSKRLGHSRPSITLNLYGHYMPRYDETLPSKIDEIYSLPPRCPQANLNVAPI